MESWDQKAAWMRSAGAVEAEWTHDDCLVLLKLGPAPVVPSADGEEASELPRVPRAAKTAGAKLVRRDE